MSWVGPAFLLALPALAIPIVIHLWRKKRRDAVPWGAMRLLIPDDPRQHNLSNLDRWLVLLARLLALACLIFALAQPLWESERYGTLRAAREDVLVLDNSMSALRRTLGERTAFDSLRKAAVEWVESRPPGTRVGVLSAAGRPEWVGGTVVTSGDGRADALLSELREMQPVSAASDLPAAVRLATTVGMSEDENATPFDATPRGVWVLSDGQAADWRAAEDDGAADELWSGLADRFEAEDSALSLHVGLAVPPKSNTGNVSVGEVTPDAYRVAPGESVEFTAVVRNTWDQPTSPTSVSWTLDGEEFDRADIAEMPAGGEWTLTTSARIVDGGSHVVRCEAVGGDKFAADDVGLCVVEAVGRVPVLVVGPRGSGDSLRTADFMSAALGRLNAEGGKKQSPDDGESGRNETDAWRSVFEPTHVRVDSLEDVPLEDHRVVVLTGPPSLPPSQLDRLAEFVESGGGLWVILGPGVDPEKFNRAWHVGGAGLSPVGVESLTVLQRAGRSDGDPEAADFAGRLHPPEGDHPALQLLSDPKRTDVDRVLVRRHWRLSPPETGDGAKLLLRLTGGVPLAVARPHGRGRVIVQATPFETGWTNWSLTRSFVVLVDQWLAYLSEPLAPPTVLAPGEVMRHRLTGRRGGDLVVKRPDGTRVPLLASPGSASSRNTMRYSRTHQAGLYAVGPADEPQKVRMLFTVRRPSSESAPGAVSSDFTRRLSRPPRLVVENVSNDAAAWLASERAPEDGAESAVPQVPLWKPLSLGLLGMLVVELLLSSYASLRRFGRIGASARGLSTRPNPAGDPGTSTPGTFRGAATAGALSD